MSGTQSSSTKTSTEIDKSRQKVGPIWLQEGVSRKHCFTLFFASVFNIGLITVVALATTYVLAVNFNIPAEERGTIIGDLAFWTEITQILLFGVIGVFSDKVGRRPVYTFGFLTLAVAYTLYPFAESIFELTIYRIIYAAGLAMVTGMAITLISDYPQNASRGLMVAATGMLNGLGVVSMNILFGRLPAMFVDAGVDDIWAGRYAHMVIAAICIAIALVIRWGIKPGRHTKREEKRSTLTLLRAGLAQGKHPRIALSYASAFVARGDLVVLGAFLTLWGALAGEAAGMSPAEATKAAAKVFVLTQTAALLWAPVAGFLMDKVNRITGIAICLFLAAIGYGLPVFVENPLAPEAMPIFIMLGIGQISAFLGSTILIGQEAPHTERGSVVGMFNVFGAIGILVAVSIGGRLFDGIAPWAPFMMIGVINFLLFVAAIVVRVKAPGFVPAGEAALFRKVSGRG
jgi:MFS family permease